MSKLVVFNPYTGEKLAEPIVVYEDQAITPEMFYNVETEKSTVTVSEEFPDEDKINHPHHYQSFNKELNIECIDAMRAAFGDDVVAAFCICNVFKYTWRHQSKNGKQDLEKAQWYLNKYLELNK